MKLMEIFVLLIFAIFLASEASGDSWEGSCKYHFNNGSFIDLSSLDNPKNPLSYGTGVPEGDFYNVTFNPCTDLICEDNNPGAMCFKTRVENNTASGVLAKTSNVTWILGDNQSILEKAYYEAIPTGLVLICADQQAETTFEWMEPYPLYKLTSKYCCVQNPANKKGILAKIFK